MPVLLYAYKWSGDSPGSRLRQARIAKELTMTELAEKANLSLRTICLLENNTTAKASIKNLSILSKILEVPIPYLGCFENLPEKTLGQRITKARLYHGYTKKDFASLLNVNVSTIRYWERDDRKPLGMYMDTLNKYLSILN